MESECYNTDIGPHQYFWKSACKCMYNWKQTNKFRQIYETGVNTVFFSDPRVYVDKYQTIVN